MNNKLTALILVVLIIFSLFLHSLWGLQLIFWSGLYLFIRQKNYLSKKRSTRQLDILGIGYPLLEIGIKILILLEVFPQNELQLNRIEHLLFSMSLTLLLYPLFNGKKFIDTALKIAAVLLFAGTLNEVFEFALRILLFKDYALKAPNYYFDTIFDEIMNICGMVIGFGLLLIRRRNSETQKRGKTSK